MSTIFSHTPASLGLGVASAAPGDTPLPRRFDSARSLATMLLAAAVAALVVLADQLIDTWADGHLLLAWVALWVVIFAGSVLFADAARNLARRTLRSLDGWSRSLAEARAEARLWEMAKLDPRLKAELIQARAREAAVGAVEELPAHDFSQALAPLGMDSGGVAPAVTRGLARIAVRRQATYLPYL